MYYAVNPAVFFLSFFLSILFSIYTYIRKMMLQINCLIILAALSLAPEEIPKQDSIDYILKPGPAVAALADETRIIFVVDISGSMCVSVPVEGQHHTRMASRRGFEAEVRYIGGADLQSVEK